MMSSKTSRSTDMRRGRRAARARLAVSISAAVGCVVAAAATGLSGPTATAAPQTSLRLAVPLPLASQADPVVAAAGDIACDPAKASFNGGLGTSSSCHQMKVSDLLVNAGLTAVLPLGDNQYYCGGYEAFLKSYDPSWGRVKGITFPAVGNHEYITASAADRTGCDATNAGAAGHFKYFGSAAGDPDKGYYSYDVGTWHMIVLNSSCSKAGGCSATSPQGKWLRADLAAHDNFCTMAYWHQPLFSSGGRASSTYKTFWDALYAADADLVLAGHDHTYERFAPQTPDGKKDLTRGIREFVVGTGGANHTSIVSVWPNSEVRNTDTYGVLKLTLRPTGYDWKFVPIAGKTFTDSGSTDCHGQTGDTTPPSAPTNLVANATSSTTVALSWSASSDDVGVVGYKVFRGGSEIGNSTGTSFTDDTAAAGTTYTYTVKAYDAGGNLSAASNSDTVTTPAGGGGGGTTPPTTLTIEASADTYIRADYPNSSYGSASTVQVDGSPQKRILLRFTVSGVGSKTVQSAKLRLYAVDPSDQGGVVHRTTGGAWSETTTWNNQPGTASGSVASFGSVLANSWYQVDVSSVVTGDGTYDLIIDSPSSNGADYVSTEGTAGSGPRLVMEVG